MSLTASAQPETRLTGRRLVLARGVWVGVVALALGLSLFSFPIQFAYFRDQINPAGLEQLRQAGLSLGFYAGYLTALNAIAALVCSIIAAVIFWRKSDDWMGIFASLTLVLAGLAGNSGLAPVGTYYPALLFLSQFVSFLAGTCTILLFYLFPNGRFVPRWFRWLVPLVVVHAAFSAFRPDLLGDDWYWFIQLASVIFALIYRYWRDSNGVERQQTKWVVFGTALGVGGLLGVGLYATITWPGGNPPVGISDLTINTVGSLSILLVPLSIGIAILRSHLWDIDLLIRRTLIYGVLTALLALVYLGAVIALQTIFTTLTGSARSELVTVLSTLAIAALFVPLRSRLQATIDHRFYRRKYDAARTLAQFGAGLRDEVNLDNLSAHLLDAVDETMQPESVGLWLKGKDEGSLSGMKDEKP